MADTTGPRSGLAHLLATIRLTGPNTRRPATTAGPRLNFTAPNYLGLADDPRVVAAAHEALDRYGSGPIITTCLFSKAIGGFGGAITGPTWAIEQIRSRGRGYVLSAALPPPTTAAALAALRLAFTSDLTCRLWDNQRRFLGLLCSRGLTVDSPTPIVPLILGDHAAARDAAQALLRVGILAMPLGPPVTPTDGARIRLVISACHTDHDLTTVADALAALL